MCYINIRPNDGINKLKIISLNAEVLYTFIITISQQKK